MENQFAVTEDYTLSPSVILIYLAVIAVTILIYWKIFTKAGKPGWAALIPIYNLIVLLEIIGRPAWWVILLLIPFVNFIILIIVSIDLAKSFGKSTLFGIGLAFFTIIFGAILAFGDAAYQGPSVLANN
ncbi:DUF5684 domain-containing protein [Solitalea lacus]|uniref:DUF5684 domain-containing protein n=1 Tax=Solitalea lacus TaxID=2911172 RepID=UPI001EDBB859|nr:DUF5684 domain-containing protein [Solitalea lacus]UKJ08953.1 DUF5684 domain-containing protein [Solitalea lacus]